jgi:ABC-2 type transport system permease protein
MTRVLVAKLLRDVRWALLAVALLLGAFQFFWAKVTDRILGKFAPLLNALGALGGLSAEELERRIFEGPGRLTRTIIGGEQVHLDSAMDMLSIGYVHPLMVTVFCIWGVGRAAGAIAGEIDKGTMELLLAQPLARWRVLLAHLLVDLITIPLLCAALWAGNWVGAWAITPIQVEKPDLPAPAFPVPFAPTSPQVDEEALQKKLRVEPVRFLPALAVVGGLVFAVSGATMWLSSAGRFRWRVLGIAVFVALVQFLVNVLGQMWDQAAWLRPLTVFYYYQPQQVILSGDWCVNFSEWNGGAALLRVPMPLVLYGVGVVGYLMALLTFTRRDLPAPL